MSLFRFSLAAALLTLPAAFAFSAPAAAIPMDTVLLQGLDKITARVSQIKVPVGGTVTFGAPCNLQPDEPKPDFLARARTAVVALKPGGAA